MRGEPQTETVSQQSTHLWALVFFFFFSFFLFCLLTSERVFLAGRPTPSQRPRVAIVLPRTLGQAVRKVLPQAWVRVRWVFRDPFKLFLAAQAIGARGRTQNTNEQTRVRRTVRVGPGVVSFKLNTTPSLPYKVPRHRLGWDPRSCLTRARPSCARRARRKALP